MDDVDRRHDGGMNLRVSLGDAEAFKENKLCGTKVEAVCVLKRGPAAGSRKNYLG